MIANAIWIDLNVLQLGDLCATRSVCELPIYQLRYQMNPKLLTTQQLAITVSDVERALKFYRDVLGLSFLFSPGSNLAFLNTGGTRLMAEYAPGGWVRQEKNRFISSCLLQRFS